jgi:hypothetical protein
MAASTNAPTSTAPVSNAPTTQAPSGCIVKETAWAKTTTSKCFTEFPDINNNKWGWSNGAFQRPSFPQTLKITFDIWAGAAQCDLTKGTKVGTGYVSLDIWGKASIYYIKNSPNVQFIEEVRAYLGSTPLYQNPNNPNADPVAPGNLPIKIELNDPNPYPVTKPNPVPSPFYFYIHFVVEITKDKC